MRTERKRNTLLTWAVLVGLGCTATPSGRAQTQTVVRPAGSQPLVVTGVNPDGSPIFAPAPAAGATPGLPGEPGASPAAETSPEEKRLQEILALQFDRRPDQILKVLADRANDPASETNELKRFASAVTVGDWAGVKTFFAALPTNQVEQVYQHLLQRLQSAPTSSDDGMQPPQMMMMPGMPQPEPFFLPDDIVALAELKPAPLTSANVSQLGQLLGKGLRKGGAAEPFVTKLESGTGRLGGSDPTNRLHAARLLIAAGKLNEAGRFLPPLDTARSGGDIGLLELHAQFLASESKPERLKQAWDLNLEILSLTNATPVQKKSAFQRTFGLLARVPESTGRGWIEGCFRDRPEQGLAALSAIHEKLAPSPANRDVNGRMRNLELMDRFATNLLAVAGSDMARWRPALNLLATAWMQEGDLTRQRYTPQRRNRNNLAFDQYGNQIYMPDYHEMMMNQDPNQVPPIPSEQLMRTAPGDGWLAELDPSLLSRMRTLLVELHLKNDNALKALPFIEALAVEQPKNAQRLAEQMLRSWATSHDPNQQNQSMPRYYYSGMPQPSGVPLTRALQAKNLQELSDILARLRRLPFDDLNEDVVVSAFTIAHSQAEVFRQQDVESVLGPMSGLKAGTLSALLQTMRQRLASQWRAARVQQDAKTKRTDKEIDAEVVRGYELVSGLIGAALGQKPDDWRLHHAKAAVLYDWAEFDYGKKVDLALYVAKRDEAFAAFAHAASLYAGQLPEPKDQTDQPFTGWFNATLGASDLSYITRQTEPDTNHLAKIRASLQALPGDAAKSHFDKFAQTLESTVQSLKPELKPRYLRAGLAVVGDSSPMEEARELVSYYDGLLDEIALAARIDGDASVGHGRPFGVFVSIQHTESLGRESGGFAKYLQNQQNMGYYYNPYGTPPVNYRDEFEKQVKEKWGEGFEIRSVTFHDDKAQPRGYGRDGWRETPYAYVLMQAKDAAADRLPSLQIDLDFFDKRGQVILPVQSQVVLLDARSEHPPERPVEKIAVTQILDDRELAEGKLSLEIKAEGHGLLPELKDLLDLGFPGFKTSNATEPTLSLTRLDTEGDAIRPITERNWLVTLTADAGSRPTSFHYPKAKREDAKTTYKRYADADLAEVEPEVALAGIGLVPSRWPLWTGLGTLGIAMVGLLVWRARKPARLAVEAPTGYRLPATITPFSVLTLLRCIAADGQKRMSPEQRAELESSIRQLESRYFGRTAEHDGQADLEAVARDWVSKAR